MWGSNGGQSWDLRPGKWDHRVLQTPISMFLESNECLGWALQPLQ